MPGKRKILKVSPVSRSGYQTVLDLDHKRVSAYLDKLSCLSGVLPADVIDTVLLGYLDLPALFRVAMWVRKTKKPKLG